MVMRRGLTAADHDVVRNSMRWLGGEAKVPMGLVSQALKPQLTDSREFGAVMRGFAQMFVTVDKKVPLFLIDELGRTTAELEPGQKHQVSHRGRALRQLRALMDRLPAPAPGRG